MNFHPKMWPVHPKSDASTPVPNTYHEKKSSCILFFRMDVLDPFFKHFFFQNQFHYIGQYIMRLFDSPQRFVLNRCTLYSVLLSTVLDPFNFQHFRTKVVTEVRKKSFYLISFISTCNFWRSFPKIFVAADDEKQITTVAYVKTMT